MKTRKKYIVACLLCACLALGHVSEVQGATITENETLQVTEETVPYVFTTGDAKDLEGMNSYTITVKKEEQKEVYVPVTASGSGLMVYSLGCKNEIVSQGAVSVAVYDEQRELVSGTEKSFHFGGVENTVYAKSFYAQKGKTYYLKLSVSEDLSIKEDDYEFQLDLQQISSENRTLKDKKVVKAYQPEEGSSLYYKIDIKKSGYITVDTLYDLEDCGNPSVVLCDSKKKTISAKASNNLLSENQSVFAVKKGIYYLKVKDITGSYQISYHFTAVTDKSGSKKSKAKKLTLGGAKLKGIVLVTEKKTKYDWYKFTLSKSSAVRITFTGSTTGSSKIKLEVIPPASNIKFDKKPILSFQGIDSSGSGKSGAKWPAGTWYIRVNKSADNGSGVYSLGVKKVR